MSKEVIILLDFKEATVNQQFDVVLIDICKRTSMTVHSQPYISRTDARPHILGLDTSQYLHRKSLVPLHHHSPVLRHLEFWELLRLAISFLVSFQ